MKKTNVERFWEQPTKYILWLFLGVVALCVLLTFMPKWFNTVFGIILVVKVIKTIRKWEKKEKENQNS